MKKFFQLLWLIISSVAEIIGFFIIIICLSAYLSNGKVEVGYGEAQHCFGDCQKPNINDKTIGEE